MGRAARALLAAGAVLLTLAGPALAQEDQEPIIDLSDYITLGAVAQWADRNGDHIPDMPVEGADEQIPEGIAGLWDDAIGATTPEEFIAGVDPEGNGFDIEGEGAFLLGPCGGAVISYDAHGNSIDAAVDLGDDDPPVDIYGQAAFTAGNPFQVDSGGSLTYFGFTLDDPGLTLGAFRDHRWELVVMEVSADNGGDPNVQGKDHNAGLVQLGDLWPDAFGFRAKVKAQGVIVDHWGSIDLPAYTADDVQSVFAGHTVCFGEGWVEFVGEGFPLFTIPGALATALVLAGFFGVLFNARPALSWRA
jgi:hypothetical protein